VTVNPYVSLAISITAALISIASAIVSFINYRRTRR
jgi:hypothetical protein